VASDVVAGAFEAEYVGVIHDPIDHRGRDNGVAEDPAPGSDGLVRRDHDRFFQWAC